MDLSQPSINHNPLNTSTRIESSSAEHSSVVAKPHNRKSPNWKQNEDVALCQAWVRCSESLIVTGVGLWNRIFDDFCGQLPETKRTKKSLENRWTSIQDDVIKWNVIVNRIHRSRSDGTNPVDEWGVCYKEFRDDHAHDFKFYHCWEILHRSVKWNDFSSGKSQGSLNPSSTPSDSLCSPTNIPKPSIRRNPLNAATQLELALARAANRNWRHNEDVVLCETWVRCSENLIITGDSLWECIFEDFCEQLHGTKRTKKSLENRWTTIQGDVTKWNVIVNRVHESRSDGTNPDVEWGVCYKAFTDDHTCAFKFYHCWEILHQSVRWNDTFSRLYSRNIPVNALPLLAIPMGDASSIGLDGIGLHDSSSILSVDNDPTSSLLPTGPTPSGESQGGPCSRSNPVNAPPPLTFPMHEASKSIGRDGIGVSSLNDSSSIPLVDNDPTSFLLPTGPTLIGESQGGPYSRSDPVNTLAPLTSHMHNTSKSIGLDGIGVSSLHDSSSILSVDNDPTSFLLPTRPTLSGESQGGLYSRSDPVNASPLLASPKHDVSCIGLNGIGVDSLHDSSIIPSADNDPPSSSTPTGPTLNGKCQSGPYSISATVNTQSLLPFPTHDPLAIGLNGTGVDSLHDSSIIPSLDNDPPSSSTPTGPTLCSIPSEPSDYTLERKSRKEKRCCFDTSTSDEVVQYDRLSDRVIEHITLQQSQFQTMQEHNKTRFDAIKSANDYHTFHLVKKLKLEQLLVCIKNVQAIGDTEETMINHAPHLMTDDVLDGQAIRLKELHELEREHTDILRQLNYSPGGNVR